jgi:preprotein translocase subunit SecE
MNSMQQLGQFLREVKIELSRVIWPTQNELIGSLVIVILLIIVASLYVGGIDFIFYRTAQYLFQSNVY